MTAIDAALLLAAGCIAGAMNALAGGGSFITFPALLLVGLPSVAANASRLSRSYQGRWRRSTNGESRLPFIDLGTVRLPLVVAVSAAECDRAAKTILPAVGPSRVVATFRAASASDTFTESILSSLTPAGKAAALPSNGRCRQEQMAHRRVLTRLALLDWRRSPPSRNRTVMPCNRRYAELPPAIESAVGDCRADFGEAHLIAVIPAETILNTLSRWEEWWQLQRWLRADLSFRARI